MLRALALALACTLLFAQVVEEAFSVDPGPLDFIRGDGTGQDILQALTGDSLVGLDASGRAVPRLAEGWEAKGAELRFRLRSGVTFADGTPLRPQDVAWTFQCLQRDPQANAAKKAWLRGLTWTLEPNGIRLKGRPPARMLVEVGRIPIAREGHPELGTGPYRLERRADGWHFLARRHFLNPCIPEIRFRLLADEAARIQNLRKGWLHIGLRPADASVRPPSTFREVPLAALTQYLVWSRLGAEPLRWLERWRSEVLRGPLLGGQAVASRGLWPEALGFPPRSIAGSPGSVRGQRWEVAYGAGDLLQQRVWMALRTRAARDGVELVLRPLEPGLLYERLLRGEFQLAGAFHRYEPHPWSVLDHLEPEGGLNLCRWSHPELAGLVARLDGPTAPAWERIHALWAQAPAALPLLDMTGTLWVDRRLEVTPGVPGIYFGTPGPAGWRWRAP